MERVNRFRSMVGLALICMWVSLPAIACLPNAQMTRAEMECCKKMAGDCQMGSQMGGGQHPCCAKISSARTLAAMVQPTAQVHPDMATTADVAAVFQPSTSESNGEQILLGLPPPSPPGPLFTLRI